MKSKQEILKDLSKVRRRKITIQKRVITEDEIKQQEEEWIAWKILWVEINNLWGEEYYAAKAVNEENTIVFTLKHVAFIEEMDSLDYRVLFQNKIYNIKNIDRIKDDGSWVKIKALERGIND